jgi:small-conductance mechanosensitive channel
LTPPVFFDEFNTDSLNQFVSCWYHPPKRWKSMAYDQQVNMEIMRRFDAGGIRLAPAPNTTTRRVQENGQAPPFGDKAYLDLS